MVGFHQGYLVWVGGSEVVGLHQGYLVRVGCSRGENEVVYRIHARRFLVMSGRDRGGDMQR